MKTFASIYLDHLAAQSKDNLYLGQESKKINQICSIIRNAKLEDRVQFRISSQMLVAELKLNAVEGLEDFEDLFVELTTYLCSLGYKIPEFSLTNGFPAFRFFWSLGSQLGVIVYLHIPGTGTSKIKVSWDADHNYTLHDINSQVATTCPTDSEFPASIVEPVETSGHTQHSCSDHQQASAISPTPAGTRPSLRLIKT